MRRRELSAFTLIELLVVIAIIAILAAILFPVFAQARDKARSTSCLSNEKQIALSLMQYTQDYDEMFPLATNEVAPDGRSAPTRLYDITWIKAVDPYVKSGAVFVCPSAKYFNRDPESSAIHDEAGAYAGSLSNAAAVASRKGTAWDYGMPPRARYLSSWPPAVGTDDYSYSNEINGNFALYDGIGGFNGIGTGGGKCGGSASAKVDSLSQADIKRPADMILIIESRSWDHGACRSGPYLEYIRTRHNRETPKPDANAPTALAPRGRANVAFADGHVKSLKAEQMFDTMTQDGVTFYKYFYGKK
jgi:prepilin-type N-terminal cleavage/methylation domain-containing protein/prepilin-type processing-associated H-X9-DG protein